LISIDSLKIRIPLPEVQILEPTLKEHWLDAKYNPDTDVVVFDADEECSSEGEITYTQAFKNRAYRVKQNGISTKYAIQKQRTNFNNTATAEFLIINATSKLLEGRYFEGITSSNIRVVYDALMAQKVVYLSFESFVSGSCTDIDFKKDICTNDVERLLKFMSSRAIPSSKKGYGYELYERRENQGIEFSHREATAFKTNPYLKIYDKALELTYNSKEFSESFLADTDYSRKVRVEVTIKNKQHFRQYGIFDTTLANIVEIPKEVKESMIRTAMKAHLYPPVREVEKSSGVKPEDQFLLNAIKLFMDQGLSFVLIVNALTSNLDKSSRSRKKKRLEDIYILHVEGSDEDKSTSNIGEICKEIFWS
jgi:hypothetical protein